MVMPSPLSVIGTVRELHATGRACPAVANALKSWNRHRINKLTLGAKAGRLRMFQVALRTFHGGPHSVALS